MPKSEEIEDNMQWQLNLLDEIDPIEEDELDEPEIESRRALTSAQESALNQIIEDYKKLGEILLGRTNVISHDIDTGDNRPSYTGNRPLSPHKEKKIEEEFLRFKSLGVVEPAQSAYRNAMTMVERYKLGKIETSALYGFAQIERYY